MPKNTQGRAFLARLAQLGVLFGILLLALISSLVVLQVAARNFFDLGLPWADELARFCGIGLVFLATPSLAGRQVLVAVTMLPDALAPAAKRWMVLLSDLATLAFAGLMLWSFAAFLPRAGKFLTPAMGVPNWFYYSLALLGTLLLTAIAVSRIIATLRGKNPTAPYHESRDDSGIPI
jgi:TRAP-type C4-dicarboxylate transport system permease small subunit